MSVVCIVTVLYINFVTGFMVSYAADCSLVTIVVKKKGFLGRNGSY